jgi:hypothetical protein
LQEKIKLALTGEKNKINMITIIIISFSTYLRDRVLGAVTPWTGRSPKHCANTAMEARVRWKELTSGSVTAACL